MNPGPTRRQFLAAAGGATLLLPVSVRAGQSDDPCGRYLDARSELAATERRLGDAEAALGADRDAHDRLLEQVVERYREVRGPPVYGDSIRDAATEVARAVRDAVVFLDMEWEGAFGPRVGTATGWFRDDGLIVTNAHNVDGFGDDDDPTLRGWTAEGESFAFEVVDYVEGRSPDVAALAADVEPPGTIPFGSTSGLAEGDPVVQVGHPGGFGHWVMTLGEVLETGEELESTVPGLAGVSGSPLVDLDGAAVGLTHGGSPAGADPWTPGTAPEPAEPTVHQYPFQLQEHSLHEPIEAVAARLEAWG